MRGPLPPSAAPHTAVTAWPPCGRPLTRRRSADLGLVSGEGEIRVIVQAAMPSRRGGKRQGASREPGRTGTHRELAALTAGPLVLANPQDAGHEKGSVATTDL